MNLVIVREGTEGFYAHTENTLTQGKRVEVTSTFSATAFTLTVKQAIVLAREGRGRITLVLKDNIFKTSLGLYREVFEETVAGARDITADYLHVDTAAMNMVMHPQRFDVIVTENLFGDILSDLAAGLMGGLGVAPGACLGNEYAVFEAVHGSAPDIAGKGIANPTALMFSGVMLLQHIGRTSESRILHEAITEALILGQTRDLGGRLNTQQFTDLVIDRIAYLKREVG
jgi:isocitrate dehydrogenase (NAD+)